MRTRVALIATAVALSSCATIERDEVAAAPAGGTVSMRTGAPLVVSLPPDPDTGYGWVLRKASPNLALIGGPDYTPAPRPPGLVGAGDTTAFRFRAVAPGPGSLEFAWSVPPGQPPQPEKVVRYDVQVGASMWLPADLFGTVGMNSMRGGDYAAASDTPRPRASDAPAAKPEEAAPSSSSPSAVKYWSN
jgi:inhibitor of cysteine peptidase